MKMFVFQGSPGFYGKRVSGFLQKILNSDSGGYSQLHEVSSKW